MQFPKLESLPSDFLEQMEGYVQEAPRKMDTTTKEVVARKVSIAPERLCLLKAPSMTELVSVTLPEEVKSLNVVHTSLLLSL